ncbi:MAG: hypothetical protein RLZZ267_1088 [Bacillota bacterium]
MNEPIRTKRHELKTVQRKQLEMTGIVKLESFDKTRFRMETDCGYLTITGQALTIKHVALEQGELIVEGHVHAIQYGEQLSVDRRSFWSKVLK